MVTPSKEQNNKNIKLSIQVSLNGLSFCALLKQEKRVVFFKDMVFQKKLNPIQLLQQVEKLYEQEEFLQRRDLEVIVLFSNELYSLVPEKLFKEENASDYLKFNTRILENDFVAFDRLENFGIVNVYIPYTNINNFFFEKYGEFEYRHCVSVLAEEFLNLNKDSGEGTKAYLNCTPGGYDLLIIQKNKLLLANSFKCKTSEDFIYYLLFTAEQLEMDPLEFELFLLGRIVKDSDFYKIAYTYVKEVKFLETSFGYLYSGKEEPPKGRMYYTLLKAVS